MKLEVFRLNEFNPDTDIIILHVDVGDATSPDQATKLLEKTRDTHFVKKITAQGFMVIVSPTQGDKKGLAIEIKDKKAVKLSKKNNTPDVDAFDKAMQVIG